MRKYAKRLEFPIKNIGCFQSSDDEYSAIPPWLRDQVEWTSQEQVIQFIAASLPTGLALVVRLHPHMCDKIKTIFIVGKIRVHSRSGWHAGSFCLA